MIQPGVAVLRIQLLGPVRAWRGDHELELGGPRRRALLGMLANARKPVSRTELIDGLWGQYPPASADNSVHVYIAGLRQVLEPWRERRAPSLLLAAIGTGYRLRLEPGRLDTEVLERHMADARRLADEDPAAAAVSLDAALRLWQGASLSGIPGPWADSERARLDELRQAATADRLDIMLKLGGHHQALAELATLILQYPLQERFRGQLMLALYRCGRQADALAAFADARRTLAEELGVDPGPALRRLHQQILTADAAIDPPLPGGRVGRVLVPRELPASADRFVGRSAELAELDRLHTAGAGSAICAVTGTAGVGKTALAVHWGHRVRDAFPGGQLYADLRGYDPGEPVSAADALAGFLRSLGLADQDIPADADERAACYRSLLDGRRALIVLDNAATVEQVRPLLPGTPSCMTVVTSRDCLAGLVARHGARRLDLDLLPNGDAVALLRELIGERVDADMDSAVVLAGQCARLPLVLRVAAELAATHPDMSLAEVTGELAGERRRLDLLDAAGDPRTAIRAVFSWSYRRLPPPAARAFRLMGAHPGPDMDTLAVAALTGADTEQAADLIRGLARGYLIYPTGPGRYAMHDLLRVYAANVAGAAVPDTSAALGRLLDYYLAAAAAAMNILDPVEAKYRPDVTALATALPAMADSDAARAWLDGERAVLVRATGHAAGGAWPRHATMFSSVLWRYLGAGHYTDAVTVHTHSCRAARQTGDRGAEAYSLSALAIIDVRLGRCQQAMGRLERAVALFRATGDRHGEGFALIIFACADRKEGRYRRAADRARRALTLLSEIGDQYAQAHAMVALGLTEARLRRYPQATEHLRGALALFRETGYRAGEASALTGLGSVACQQDRLPDAVRDHGLAFSLFRETGDRAGQAAALNGLGEAALLAGDIDAARGRHTAALALAREIGDKLEEARAWEGLTSSAAVAGTEPVRPMSGRAGRPERPLDPRDGPLSRFAYELRQLRAAAGYPTYRALAKKALFAPSVLSTAASGLSLPTLQVALAYAAACGGDPGEWRKRWEAVAAELALVLLGPALPAQPYRPRRRDRSEANAAAGSSSARSLRKSGSRGYISSSTAAGTRESLAR